MISINNLSDEIAKVLSEYSQDVSEKVDKAVDEAGNDLIQELTSTSPARKCKNGGRYHKGWRIKVAFDGKGNKRIIVHNKSDFQLTHLLEFGHIKVNGGRVSGIPHIKPAEQKAVDMFIKKVEEAVKG